MWTVIFGVAMFVIGVIVGININRWSTQSRKPLDITIWEL
jgi:uncharacterized membrane protein YoaK (UPF0700 family)